MGNILKKLIAVLAVILAIVGIVTYFSEEEHQEELALPPQLIGRWVQVGATEKSDWYFYADIFTDRIEIWWYLPSDNERALYWWGTFTPPVNGKIPYEWVSVNDLDMAHTSQRASREPEKTFTYKDDRISYVLTAGHLQMGYALERAADSAVGDQLPPRGED